MLSVWKRYNLLKSWFVEMLRNNQCEFHIQLRNAVDDKKVQVGKDQENAPSEKDSHSKNRGGKKPN